jgi:Mrp family chromosome partitioning ATPase
MIVGKAANMANMMNIPVLGLVENMSYAVCPDCGKRINIYGDSHILEIAQSFGYDVLGQIPLDSKLATLCDSGKIEDLDADYLDIAATVLEHRLGLSE